MGSSIRLGRVLGIDLRLDYSWLVIFILLTLYLATQYFPMAYSGGSLGTYWGLGILTSLLFFGSVVVHELGHSVVSQGYGIPVRDITLFIFGGATNLSKEPERARDELLMALAGPGASFALAGLFGILWWLSAGVSEPLHAVTGWLAGVNAAVGLFNLIPGLPLDGGRVFRAIVWGVTGNVRRATRIATGLGRLVAFGFILWGVWQVVGGNWIQGLWIAFIGCFLLSAATSSDQQHTLQEALAGHTVREVMLSNYPKVPRRLTLDLVVDQFVLPTGRRCFPVGDDGQLEGLITLHKIKGVSREAWPTTRVEDVMIPLANLETVRPDDGILIVLKRMARMAAEDVNQFPVIENGRLVGMVARGSLLSNLRTGVDLEPKRVHD